MKYLCLVYGKEVGDYATRDEEYLRYYEDLRQSGYRSPAEVLDQARPVITVQVRNGVVSVMDGPAAAAEGQLAAFFLVDARDLNDAIRMAANDPLARIGSVEVRPVGMMSARKV